MDFIPAGLHDYLAPLLIPSWWPHPLVQAFTTARALILPIVDRFTSSPDLASVALLLIILWISLKILGMVYRAVMFWVMLVARIVFWGAMVFGAVYAYNRGAEGVVEDVSTAWGVWMGEYRYWKEKQEEMIRLRDQQRGYRPEWR